MPSAADRRYLCALVRHGPFSVARRFDTFGDVSRQGLCRWRPSGATVTPAPPDRWQRDRGGLRRTRRGSGRSGSSGAQVRSRRRRPPAGGPDRAANEHGAAGAGRRRAGRRRSPGRSDSSPDMLPRHAPCSTSLAAHRGPRNDSPGRNRRGAAGMPVGGPNIVWKSSVIGPAVPVQPVRSVTRSR